MLTVRAALARAEQRLRLAGVETAGLDARVLLRSLLDLSATALYRELDRPLDSATADAYTNLVDRRAGGEPVAYLTGHREFYGLDLLVTPDVLIPRPETELLVERAIALLPRGAWVVDVGTGSGAIAAAVAVGRPDVRLLAVDAAPDACQLARRNVAHHGLADRVGVVQGDLLQAVRGPVDGLLANLPYLDAQEMARLPPAVQHEPPQALDGGPDGLDVYRRLLADVHVRRLRPSVMLCEIGPAQGAAMRALAERYLPGYALRLLPDLAGRVRLLEAVKPGA